MTTFLFWNLQGRPLQNLVADLATSYDIGIIMLAECDVGPYTLLNALNRQSKAKYYYSPNIGCKKIEIFTRFDRKYLHVFRESERLTIRRLALPRHDEILLAVTHFPSKMHWDEDDQLSESIEISMLIKDAETQVGHSRTVLVGDFNMNPFESGVVNANALHGVMSRQIAMHRHRVVQGKNYPFFYNPMWGLFGDRTSGPSGTHYYRGSGHKVFFWNMYDQVLIRPDLLSQFDSKNLEILTTVGTIDLMTANGLPDTNKGSDHLPLMFKINTLK